MCPSAGRWPRSRFGDQDWRAYGTFTADLERCGEADAARWRQNLNDAKNTAQWTWEGSDKPGEDDTTPNFSYNMIRSKKDGTSTADDIAWEVTLNPAT